MKRKLIVLTVTSLMIASLALPVFGASKADSFSDLPNNAEAKAAVISAIENGLLQGDDGEVNPTRNLKRSEMATIINRAFGATVASDISKFTDVPSNEWYYVEMGKAVKMKTFEGDGSSLRPNDSITREEAFTVIARALMLDEATKLNKTFKDSGSISSWAKGSVYAMINNGYVNGDAGNISPTAKITRQDFAIVLNNIIKSYITTPGTVTTVAPGTVMVNAKDVTIKDVTVNGDLIVGEGSNNLKLENVTVTGKVIVRGGTVTVTGTLNRLVMGEKVIVNAVKATIKNVDLKGADSTLDIDIDSVLDGGTIRKTATGSKITGKGKINNVTDLRLPGAVEVVDDEFGLSVARPGIIVQGGSTGGGSTGGGGSAGGGTTTNKVDIGSVTLTSSSNSNAIEKGNVLTATVSPTNATVTYKWTSGGVEIKGHTSDKYTVALTDIGKTITVTATGTGNYQGVKSATTALVSKGNVSIELFVNGNKFDLDKLFASVNTGDTVGDIVIRLDEPINIVAGKNLIYANIEGGTRNVNKAGTFSFDVTTNEVTIKPEYNTLTVDGNYEITIPAGSFKNSKEELNEEFVFKLEVKDTTTNKISIKSVELDNLFPTKGNVITAKVGDNANATYRWFADDEVRAETSKTYTTTLTDIGKVIKVEATGTGNYKGTVTSAPTAKVSQGAGVKVQISIAGKTPIDVTDNSATIKVSDTIQKIEVTLDETITIIGSNNKIYGRHKDSVGTGAIAGTFEIVGNKVVITPQQAAFPFDGEFVIYIPAGSYEDANGSPNSIFIFNLKVEI